MFYRWVGTLLFGLLVSRTLLKRPNSQCGKSEKKKINNSETILFSYTCKNSHNTVITSLACTMTTMWTLHEFYISDFLVFR